MSAEALISPGVLATLPEPALALDPAGTIVDANDLAAETFGRSVEDLTGLAATLLLPVEAPLREALADAERRAARRKLEGRRADGTPFPLEVALRRGDGEGDDGALLVLVHEVEGERLLSARPSARSTSRSTHTPIGMALFNTDGEYVRVNAALCRMLDRAPAELLGRRDQELTHPDDRESDLDAAWRILAASSTPGRPRSASCARTAGSSGRSPT